MSRPLSGYKLVHIAREHALRTCIVTCHTLYLCTHTHTHTHTHTRVHTHTHTQRDWACITCSDFGFFFFSQIVHVHECTHLCTHTHAHTHTCTHIHAHTHTDWACTTCSDFGFFFSYCFHKSYMCMNVQYTHVHTHAHTHRLGRLYHLQRLWVLISHTI